MDPKTVQGTKLRMNNSYKLFLPTEVKFHSQVQFILYSILYKRHVLQVSISPNLCL